ncbi:MAG: type II toxin-antitoxin system RelE family toxin [Desulfonatronovibrionaceae bacterium]
MGWRIKFTPQSEKDLRKIDRKDAQRISRFLQERASPAPRETGKRLKGQLREFWRYRVGDYRILTKIDDKELIILVVHVRYRKKSYT